ncbi:hypothetical protein U1Q18_024050 [Sarracenia purpurea var. burkii]
MASHLQNLGGSSRTAAIRQRSAYFPALLRRYSPPTKGSNGMERAPTTAEEFERVAEEKARQGFASQAIVKAQDDGVGEGTFGDSRGESGKKYSKEDVGEGSFHKKSDE